MLTIQKKLTPYNYEKMNNKVNKYIVIHYVGSVSTALNNANYFYNNKLSSSAHYFVDENSIWQSVEDKNKSWHCGGGLQGSGGHTFYQKCTNSNSIGIEMCVKKTSAGSWYFEPKTLTNTIQLTQYLMKLYNISIDNVIRHYDVTGKQCPAIYTNDTNWATFKSQILNDIVDDTKIIATGIVNTDNLNVRNGIGTSNSIVATLNKGDKVYLYNIANNWGKINTGWINLTYVDLDNVINLDEEHWAKKYLTLLKNKNIIETPEAWLDFDNPVSKGMVIVLLDKLTGGIWASDDADKSIHWAHPSVISLCGKEIIKDIFQWNTSEILEDNISKSLLLALICNIKGGILSRYENRSVDHWGRNCLDSLCDYGIIETPEAWIDFDNPVSKGNVLALLYKSLCV